MALGRDKAIVIGVVVLGGLSFLVWKQAKHDQELGSAAKTDLPQVKVPDDLDKIELTNGEKGTVTLQKQGDKWMLMPQNVPASASNIKMMLDNAKELKPTEIVAANPDDATKASYNLDAAHALHFVGYKGNDKKVDELFGKSGGRGEMVMITGKPEIIAASGYSSYLYTREAKDWRDHDIFKFDQANATSLTIDNKNGKFSCTKGDKWACTLDGKPIPNFDDNKPNDAVRAMQYLVAEDFPPEGKTVANTGLDKPATISVALKDNAGTYTLKVGDVASGTSRYAMKEGGDGTIYIVNPNVSEWAVAKAERFQKTVADAGAPKKSETASTKKP